jgi:phosphonate transport system substrate-binding protein
MLPLAACSSPSSQTSTDGAKEALIVGAIPDQDPEELQRKYQQLATYLEQKLGVPVEYKPVTDYAAAVTAFKVGDLDLVWFGGLTGFQARLQVPEQKRSLNGMLINSFIVYSLLTNLANLPL